MYPDHDRDFVRRPQVQGILGGVDIQVQAVLRTKQGALFVFTCKIKKFVTSSIGEFWMVGLIVMITVEFIFFLTIQKA